MTQWKIFATGGGSFKYEARFKDMGIRVRKSDEMETIVSATSVCGLKLLVHEALRKSDEMETLVSATSVCGLKQV